LIDALPDDLARQSVTHASWVDTRAAAYDRLAFLGDSVLGLAVTQALWPRLDPASHGAGRLTQVRAAAVSGRACRQVGERLAMPERMAAVAPPAGVPLATLLAGERVLASVVEAVIGACHLTYGFDPTALAVAEAFAPEIEAAIEDPGDWKSALQERLARRGETVAYAVVEEVGPPHERRFTVAARVGEAEVGRGAGRSKKDAEQAAARAAMDGGA